MSDTRTRIVAEILATKNAYFIEGSIDRDEYCEIMDGIEELLARMGRPRKKLRRRRSVEWLRRKYV